MNIKKIIAREGLILLGFMSFSGIDVLWLWRHRVSNDNMFLFPVALLLYGYLSYLFLKGVLKGTQTLVLSEKINPDLRKIIEKERIVLFVILSAMFIGFYCAVISNAFGFGIFKEFCGILMAIAIISLVIPFVILPTYLVYLLIRFILWAIGMRKK